MKRRLFSLFVTLVVMGVSVFVGNTSPVANVGSGKVSLNDSNVTLATGTSATLENGKLTMPLVRDVPYQASLVFDGLTDNYTMTGKIKIIEVINTGDTDVSIWNGLRIIIGRKDTMTYNTISMYRTIGTQIVNNSTVGIGPIVGFSNFTFADGNEFDFKVTRNGNLVTYFLNGLKVINYTLADSENLFEDDVNDNIGFISMNTHYEVTDLLIQDGQDSSIGIGDFDASLVGGSYASIENNKLIMPLIKDSPYQASLNFEGLESNYNIAGKITIKDVINTGDSDISIWNGIRIIFGRTDFLRYNTVSLYRNVGIQLVNNSTVGIGAIKGYPSKAFTKGTEFEFLIQKRGNRVIFYVDGYPVINYTLEDAENLFTVGGNNNIGFIGINTYYEVSDLVVHNDDTEISEMLTSYIYNKDNIPKITFPGIKQEEFDEAFKVLEEAVVLPSPLFPVYGFTHPFCGPGGQYGACWWQLDTALALSGTKWVNQEFSENVIRNFILIQKPNGRIPLHGPDTLLNEDNKCSSLPKLFQVTYEVMKRTDDQQLIEDSYKMLTKYLDWWLTERKDADTGLILGIVEEWLPGSSVYTAPVETNVEVIVGCNIVAKLAKLLHYDDDYTKYTQDGNDIKTAINTYLWNEKKGCYMNYNTTSNRFSGLNSVTSFDTFKLNIAPQTVQKSMLEKLLSKEYQWDTNPLTSASKIDPLYNETEGNYAACQWYGSIWSLRNYAVLEGLEDIGRSDLSSYLALRTVHLFNNNYAEFLNPSDGMGQGVLKYSWSASQYIQILIEHIFGINYDNFSKVLTISPNLDLSLLGETIALEDLLLPNGNRLNVTIINTDKGISVEYEITGEADMADIDVIVSIPSYQTAYQVEGKNYEKIENGYGTIYSVNNGQTSLDSVVFTKVSNPEANNPETGVQDIFYLSVVVLSLSATIIKIGIRRKETV